MPFIPYPGEVCDFCKTSYPTRVSFVASVQHHTLTRPFCNFCNNIVPVPGYGVCISYPYPGEVCDFCTTLYPTVQVLWLLYVFHTLTWQFCNFCNKSHTLQKVPVPYRTQPYYCFRLGSHCVNTGYIFGTGLCGNSINQKSVAIRIRIYFIFFPSIKLLIYWSVDEILCLN